MTIPIVIENAKLKLALAIPTVAPIAVGNEAIEMLPLVADKTIKTCQNGQKNNKKTIDLCYSLILFHEFQQ